MLFKKTTLILVSGVIAFTGSLKAAVGIKVSSGNWHAGEGGSGVYSSTETKTIFSVENIGDEPVDVSISATDTQDWTLTSGSPEEDKFALEWFTDTNNNYIATTDTELISPLDNTAPPFEFNLAFHSPSELSDNDLTDTQYSTITISATGVPVGEWITQIIHTDDYLGNNSIVLDSNNSPHITFTYTYAADKQKIYYAHYKDESWSISTIDPGWSNKLPEITIDNNDLSHVAYYDTSSGFPDYKLKYAKQTKTGWDIQTVAQKALHPSIDTDSQNNPHIAYVAWKLVTPYSIERYIKYAKWTGSDWEIKDVATGSSCSLFIDSNDIPHIAFSKDNRNIIYAKWNGTNWDKETVGSKALLGSLEVDTNNVPHIVYRDTENYNLYYAKKMGSNWEIKMIDNLKRGSKQFSLSIDNNNIPHLIYQKDSVLKYTTGSDWDIQTFGPISLYVSIATDSNNFPHMVYRSYSPFNSKLYYKKWH